MSCSNLLRLTARRVGREGETGKEGEGGRERKRGRGREREEEREREGERGREEEGGGGRGEKRGKCKFLMLHSQLTLVTISADA